MGSSAARDEEGRVGVAAMAAEGPRGRPSAPLTAFSLRQAVERKQEKHQERHGTMCDHDGPCDTSNPLCR